MAKADKQSSYNFIDLFAGAGGLSEGFIQAGFRPVAHVEMNEYAAKTLETRSAYYYLKNSGNLALYGKYLSGDISRDELMKMIPASVTKTVINETLSDETLPQLRFFVWRLKIVHRTRAMPASTSQRRTKPKVRRNSDVIWASVSPSSFPSRAPPVAAGGFVFGLRLGNIQARRAGACFRLGGHMVQFPLETSSLCCGKIVQKLLKKN